MATLDVEGVVKAFDGGARVLDGVSFAAREGEFVSILGASGCGKSTLLRVVAGLESPDEGRVRIGGEDVTGRSPKDRDVAMVFQSYALYPHLSVFDNVAVGLKLRGHSPADTAARVREAAQMLGLEGLLDRKPSALSGGQRQRVALARCLVRRPKLFLLDEPLSNLDAVLRERTRGELKLLFKRARGTVVYVTHDQVEALTMSDRIVLLDRGRVRQAGPPKEIYETPADVVVAGFLGSPPMNVLEAAAAARAGLIAREEPGVLVGVRPESLRVEPAAAPGLARASVAVAEPMGAQTVLTLDASGETLRALVFGHWEPREEVFVGAPKEALHRFAAATGLRLVG